MTQRQRFEHKLGNQMRKQRLMHIQRTCPKQDRGYWARYGLIQDGKATPLAPKRFQWLIAKLTGGAQ